MIRAFISFLEDNLSPVSKLLLAGIPVVALLMLGSAYLSATRPDPIANTVAITNRAGNSGGTGVILESTSALSKVLTNAHVCRLVEGVGGLVQAKHLSVPVSSTQISQEHDLCILRVNADLGHNTRVARRAPIDYYEKATVSGHPALLPNVVTTGHFSGSRIIPVMSEIKKCTAADMEKGSDLAKFLCLMLGGLPQVTLFDSQLVTATIMPGSSGSAVYNSDGELSGLVFAGQGQLGYAWTVPFRALRHFLDIEAKGALDIVMAKNDVPLEELLAKSKSDTRFEVEVLNKLKEACAKGVPQVKDYCKFINMDLIWRANDE